MDAASVPVDSTGDAPNSRAGGSGVAITARAFGVTIALRADDPQFLAKLVARLPPGSQTIDAAPADFEYSVSRSRRQLAAEADENVAVYNVGTGQQTIEIADETDALDFFESTVRFDVAASSTDWLFVHAGVVGWRGQAIVIPAPSMHGKSRLTEALVQAGADYYSDEFAVFDHEGRVHPFRLAASLREPTGRARRVVLAATPDPEPLPIGLVIATRYEPDVSWQPRRGTPGEAALALLANTVRARIAPAHTLKVLARAAERAVLLEAPRGEAADTARHILAGISGAW